jgi:glycosyltransferase involved in cell wall biosynthesis
MNLNILICTIDEGIKKVNKILHPLRSDVKYIVSHQYRDEKHKFVPKELQREDVIVSQIPGVGLSRNRNNALRLADGDIALIADDDVSYLPNAFEEIKKVFHVHPDLDVALFKIKTPEGEPEYKKYPEHSYSLTHRGKKHSISSIEMTFRINPIKQHKILFDERFGLGSDKIFSGEEAVFINDCIKKKLNVNYLPIFIVHHPYLSSTKTDMPNVDYESFKWGARAARTEGWMSIFSTLHKFVRLTPSYFLRKRNPLRFLYYRMKGVLYIFKTNIH